MIKSCMGNYLNCLKHTFTVLGILFLGIMLGLSAFLEVSSVAVSNMTTQLETTYQEADLDPGYIRAAVTDRLQNITFQDILDIMETGNLSPLLEGEINEALNKVVDNYSSFADRTAEIVEECAGVIAAASSLLFVAILISQIIGFFATEIGVRESLDRTNIFKVILEMLVRLLGYAVVFFLVYQACRHFPDYRQIFLYASPVLFVLISLICAWVTGRSKQITFKTVVTLKNILLLLIADVLMLAISALIVYLLYQVINPVVSFVIAMELVVVVVVALDLSALSCLDSIREKAKETTEPVA